MDEVQNRPGFFAVIPANVRYDDRLQASAKLLYGEISALANADGFCFAKNDYFANLYQQSDRNIKRLLRSLEEFGYIQVRFPPSSGKDDEDAAGRRIFIDASAAALFDKNAALDCSNRGVTKMSPGDKNVTGGVTKMSPDTLINNNKYIYSKKDCEVASRAQLMQWAESVCSDPDDLQNLKQALAAFCDSRIKAKKPIDTDRKIKILTGRLWRISEGDVSIMILILDEAVFRGWDSVYPLQNNSKVGTVSRSEEVDDKWL